jgi:hypothetical protein
VIEGLERKACPKEVEELIVASSVEEKPNTL